MCELVGLLAGEVGVFCKSCLLQRVVSIKVVLMVVVCLGEEAWSVVGFRTLNETRFVNCRKWSITFLSPLRLARQEFGPQFFP